VAASAFWCDACDVEWADGVDYEACPRCGGAVRLLEIAPEHSRATAVPSVPAMARATLFALVAVQVALAVAAPDDFAYLRTVLVVAQLAAAVAVVLAVALVRAIRGLVTERVRILHGLEHATIAVLGERGIAVASGVTYPGVFELELVRGQGAKTGEPEIAAAANDAIARVGAGERTLVYTPRCGTSLLVGWLLVAVAITSVGAIALAMHVPHGYAFALTIALVAAARRARYRIGLAAQRAFTVSASFASARVGHVLREVSASGDVVSYWVRVDVEPVASAIAESI
jgi:hypothetical protein